MVDQGDGISWDYNSRGEERERERERSTEHGQGTGSEARCIKEKRWEDGFLHIPNLEMRIGAEQLSFPRLGYGIS